MAARHAHERDQRERNRGEIGEFLTTIRFEALAVDFFSLRARARPEE